MPYRKRTLRRLPPVTRKLARLIDRIGALERAAKALLEEVNDIEQDSRALKNMNKKVKLGVVDTSGERIGPEGGVVDLFLEKGTEGNNQNWGTVA